MPCIRTGTIENKAEDYNLKSQSTLAIVEKSEQKSCNKCKHANMTSRSFMKGIASKTTEKPQNSNLMDFVKRQEPNRTFII